ncbi:ATP-binding protein [Streptomyces albidoflavus]|uniref:ATP-binding protein n=1 Tax=Streptomyces albidoflavus TaxID=1886 RepID=UPI000A1C9A5E|nr:ATP-binding protein [Streptomyces albidoflavus]
MIPATAVATTAAETPPQTSRVFEVAITPDPIRVARIRRIATAFLRYWAVPAALTDDVVHVVSELVANAVEHGRGTVGLRMWHTDDELRVEVTDENPTPARLRTAGIDDECGRGMFLVAVLSKDWGVDNDGRTTWATFRSPTRRPR